MSASAHKSTSNIYAHELNTESLSPSPEVTNGNGSRNSLLYPPIGFTPTINLNLPFELGFSVRASNSSTFRIQEYPPGVKLGPLVSTPNPPVFAHIEEESDHILDEDEEDVFKPTEWFPETLQLLNLYLCLEPTYLDGAQWSSVINSYFTFFIRYSYDPSNLPSHLCHLITSHCQLESARLAVLGTSLLFHSFFNPGLPQAPLRRHANELIDAATTALRFEESQPNTTLYAQLAGISEILGFYGI
ncbi:hypothetical protein B0J17DRAFT_34612 [Rhizoctonia solani]|nr:hypothetical protein B0J17DRAFT_34612 [Rhizoctonia solani]